MSINEINKNILAKKCNTVHILKSIEVFHKMFTVALTLINSGFHTRVFKLMTEQ